MRPRVAKALEDFSKVWMFSLEEKTSVLQTYLSSDTFPIKDTHM